MIINFSIENFGPVKDKQTLSFEAEKSDRLEDFYVMEPVKGLRLLKLALIYGANASGKSTILEALQFLKHMVLEPLDKKTASFRFHPFLFDEKTPTRDSELTIEFLQEGIRYAYSVRFNRHAIVNEELRFFNPNKAVVFTRTTDVENQFTEIKFGGKVKTDKSFEKSLASNTLWNNTVLGGYLKTNIEFKELKAVTSWFSEYLLQTIDTGSRLENYISKKIQAGTIDKESVLNILKQADFNITDIQITDEKEVPEDVLKFFSAMSLSEEQLENIKKNPLKRIALVHVVKEKNYALPFGQESQGTQRFYSFAGLLSMLIHHPAAVCIDELESSLHPDLYIHFLLSFLANAKQSQIIATSHNRELLNNKDLYRNDAIWITNKAEDSATELYSLADIDSSIIRNTSSIYNAYKTGKLGGVPNLGDYYIDFKKEHEVQ